MSTTRSVITRNLSTTSTAVYTNTSGGTSVLKSLNVNGGADPATLTTAAGASEWSFFGSNLNPLIQDSSANGVSSGSFNFGIPYPVQLSADRVLLIYLPHYMHLGGANDFMTGNIVHTQIVEYTGSLYRAGPIVNVTLPTTVYAAATAILSTTNLWTLPATTPGTTQTMTGGYGQSNFRAVALSSTKVVCAYRVGTAFRLVRLNISGNAVDLSTVANVDLTGASYFNLTTAGAYDLAKVPGATTKVLVAGYTATNWSVQAINIPDTGALSNASALFSTTIAASLAGGCTIAPMAKTAVSNSNAYIFAGATSATNVNAAIVTYNSSTDALAVSGSTQSYPRTTQITGIQAVCLSTDATANAVLAMTDSGAPSLINFRRHTSLTQVNLAANGEGTFALQHATTKSIVMGFNWGDERAVFTGETGLCVSYDSAGVSTNITPATETTNTQRFLQMWIPFNSRPLYNMWDPASIRRERVAQWYSRTNITSSTSAGTHTATGNYFPWGHDYGGQYCWNEQTSTWIVGSYGRLYNLNASGVIVDEISLYQLSTTLNYTKNIKQVQVLPSGKILLAIETYYGVQPGYETHKSWTSMTGGTPILLIATTPHTILNKLQRISLSAPIFTCPSGMFAFHMTQFQAAPPAGSPSNTQGEERAICLWMKTTSATVGETWNSQFYNGAWYLGLPNGNFPWALNGTHCYGHRGANLKLIQDTPADNNTFPTGLWRMLGAQLFQNSAQMQYICISNNPLPATNIESLNRDEVLSSATHAYGYAMTFKVSPGGRTQVAAMYDNATSGYANTFTTIRIWSSTGGHLNHTLGFWPATGNGVNTNLKFASVAVGKFGFAVGYCNTDSTSNLATVAYVFTSSNPNTPVATLTPASGHGYVTTNQVDKLRFSVYGTSVDALYTQAGVNDTVQFYANLFDGTNEFPLNPGQTMSSNDTASYRSNDTYFIPNNYSLRLRADTPNSLHSLVTLVEEA